jgi:phosphatidylglycerophosphate synthase
VRVFGLSLLERLLRSLTPFAENLEEVRVELPADAATPALGDRRLSTALPLVWSRSADRAGRRLQRAFDDAGGEPWLAFSADCVIDARLIEQVLASSGNVAFVAGEGADRGALLRLEQPVPGLEDATGLLEAAEAAVASDAARSFGEREFRGYIANLRRDLPPYLFRVADDAARDRCERFLFGSNYKGSTDFMTKYVYPPLVWRMVRPLARWHVHPNVVTIVSIIATFAAIPLFARGAWLPGLALAFSMTVLDSVDGKLARVTFTSSKLGEILDHGVDIVHPPMWYMAWAFALGAGDLQSPAFRASLLMLGVYVVDRLFALVFRSRTGVSIHGCTPLDEKVRTFVSRRNVNLVIFTLALSLDALFPGLGAALVAFYAIVAWQLLSAVWHAERLAHFWNAKLAT